MDTTPHNGTRYLRTRGDVAEYFPAVATPESIIAIWSRKIRSLNPKADWHVTSGELALGPGLTWYWAAVAEPTEDGTYRPVRIKIAGRRSDAFTDLYDSLRKYTDEGSAI